MCIRDRASTGADIIEIGPDYVVIHAAAQEASQIAKLGYPIEQMAQTMDFPSVDAAYHNYAEMVTDGQAVAAAHPDIVSLVSIGASYEGRTMWAAKISEVPAKDIKRIALEFAAAAPKAMIPTYKRDAAGPNYANSWRLRHAINILNSLVGSIDHEGAILLFHDVKLPWLDEITPPVKPYPPLPAKQADFREEFPVTNNIYKNKDFSAPGHYGMIAWGLYKAKRGKAVFFRNPHRGLFAMIQSQMMEAAADRLDLVVDWNLYLDDLGYFCDYVVPAPHQFEEGKLDIRLYLSLIHI